MRGMIASTPDHQALRPASRPPLRPLDDALAELLAQARPLSRTETVPLVEADGRVLAHDLVSPLQVPPHDNSAMDGYALRAADVAVSGAVLAVSQRIPAGTAPLPLALGTAARIFTGAPLPEGADSVVMQEETEPAAEGTIRFTKLPKQGQNVRFSGEDVQQGAVVLRAGDRIGPAALGLAASMGLDRLLVAARPRVALLSTGDELVMPGTVPPAQMPAGAIYNSNRFFLRRLLERAGCEVSDLGNVPDTLAATVQALGQAAAGHDLVLASGGVSVGEEDHLRPAVQALGRLDLWQVAVKPGKPFAYGQIGATHVMGLPGNPVSSFLTFLVLARPFLLRLQGASELLPPSISLPAGFDWPRPDKRREFLRVRRNAQGTLDLFPNQGSGVLTSMAWADGLVDNPPGQAIARGDMVRFISLADWL